jgi:hypothetical protein
MRRAILRTLAVVLCAVAALAIVVAMEPVTAGAASALQTPSRGARGRPVPARPPAPKAPAPRVHAPVPFKAGETLTYEVSWSSFIVAGTATATVAERKPSFNSSAYYIVAEGRPVPLVARLYALYYKMDTLLDSYVLLSQRGSFYSEEGANHRFATTRFDRNARRAFYEEKKNDDPAEKNDLTVPAQAQDGLAAFYALRAKAFKPGDRWTVPVADSGALFTTQVEVGAVERVRVPLGEMDAWKLRVVLTDTAGDQVWKDVAVWMSTDARRLPVKMQAELPVGAFVLALTGAK